MKYFIFDFNGTILNDVELCLEAINHLILKYLDRDILSLNEYRSVFEFPVSNYYQKLGFDFNKLSFDDLAHEWLDYYLNNFDQAYIYDGVKQILKNNLKLGYKNYIISASQQNMLSKQVKTLGLEQYFEDVLGISDIYARSKYQLVEQFILDKDKQNIVMLGDTTHDAEIAHKLGIKCILIAQGHQHFDILKETNCTVVHTIKEINYD